MPDGVAIITDDEDLLFSPSSTSTEAVDSGTKRLPLRRPASKFDEEPTRKAHAPKAPRKVDDTPPDDDDPWSSQ
jgi:hypothetical protein